MFGGCFEDKRVLVTGVTGFKGSWLALWLLKLGAKVLGLANGIPTDPSHFAAVELSKSIDYVCVDVRDLDSLVPLVKDFAPDFLFHLAAQAVVKESLDNPFLTFSTNTIGTAAVLESLRQSNASCCAVIITSDKCYENNEWVWGYREEDRLGGKDPYSASKAAAEQVISAFHRSFFASSAVVRICSARAGNVIGGGDWAESRIVPDAIKAWSQRQAVKVRNPNTTRPWQHVLEPLSGYLRLAQVLYRDCSYAGRSYNFGPRFDENLTVLSLIEELSKYWNFSLEHQRYCTVAQPSNHEAALLRLNCDRALLELNWTPVLDVSKAAQLTATWYNGFYNANGASLRDLSEAQLEEYVKNARERGQLWTS
jgi:CDP-glucose 4,6-dehydratase